MQIYIYKNNQQTGPFEESKVLGWLAGGQLSPNDMAIKQGDNQWKPLKDLFPQVTNQPPIPPQNIGNLNPPVAKVGNLEPKSGSGAKIFLFLLLGFGFLILVAAVGIGGFLYFNQSNRTVVSTDNSIKTLNSNSSNTNSNSSSSEPDFKALKDKAKELAKLSPPLKLESKPVLKGKIAIVEQTDTANEYSTPTIKGIHSYDEKYDDYELEQYGLTKEKLAAKSEEIDTLVQTLCVKGNQIGRYNTRLGSIPAFSKVCKVSIIDYRGSKVVAQKSFVNRKLEPTIKISETTTEYVLLYPYAEIQKYVKGLSKE